MASSFNGVTIVVLATDVPRKGQAQVSVRQIPGGNQSYVDIGGNSLRTLSLELLFATGALGLSFEAQVNQAGSLITFDGTFNALLMSAERVAHGVMAGGECVYRCEFLLL